MIRSKLLFIILVFGFFIKNPVYGQFPKITKVKMKKCSGKRVVYQGETFSKCSVWGTAGLASAFSASVSGSGVTAQIIGHYPAAKLNPPRDKIKIKFTVSGSASATKRTVTIKGPGWSDSFKIYVRKKAKITGAEVPESEVFFKNNVDVLLKGKKLTNIKYVSAVILSPVHDENGNSISPSLVTVTSAINNTTPQTSSQVLIRLNFSKKLTQAKVRIQLFGDPAKCGALRAHSTNPLKKTITIKAKPSKYNYVKSITFPYGQTFSVGSLATIQIDLEKPVEPSTGQFFLMTDGTASSAGAHVLWKLIPSNVFEEAPGGTSYNPNGLNTMIITPGNEFGQITVKVKECPSSGNGTTSTVKIQTWRLNKNTYQPPWYKEQLFNISCPEN
ncbi:MAG: hypothetical protein D6813_07600 [Calditrichaeota bacterium]|nr:MAG: hypothetical protein D6813_07600 [Calditrichota bacterium]